jgi:lysozyme
MLERLITQLRRDEGVRLKPYKDTVGKLTIGIGRNLDDVGISNVEADTLLKNDIARTIADLDKQLPWWTKLDEARRGVILNMAFNMGIGGLLTFKNTLRLIEQARYNDAADSMLQSKWATQVGPRATRLAQQMRSGTWQ